MNIGFQYWAEGGSAAGSWTTVDVLTCFPREAYQIYDQKTFPDGSKKTWARKYLLVSITFKPNDMSSTTPRVQINKIMQATYFRIKDTRHASLGDANTIEFVKAQEGGHARDTQTLLSETATLELISSAVVTLQT